MDLVFLIAGIAIAVLALATGIVIYSVRLTKTKEKLDSAGAQPLLGVVMPRDMKESGQRGA